VNESSVQGSRRLSELLPLGAPPLGLQALPLLATGDPGAFPRLPLPAPLLQALPEASKGEATVAVLTAVIPSGGRDPGGEMGQPDAAFGGVLVLSPRATGAEGVDPALAQEGFVVRGDGEIVGHGVESDPDDRSPFHLVPGTPLEEDGVRRRGMTKVMDRVGMPRPQ